MNISPLMPSNNINFSGKYSAEYICADLCKGACCNHGTPMNIKLKAIAERLFAPEVQTEASKKPVLLNWLCLDSRAEVNAISGKSKMYLDRLFREKDAVKRAAIMEKLNEINQELERTCGDSECFSSITNPNFADNPRAAIYPTELNPCVFKDHGRTNKCTIYHGASDEAGNIIPRPQACLDVGGEKLPCPWLNPEKYSETVLKTRAMFARQGYGLLPIETCQQNVAKQFNLNETFMEEIWKPFIESKSKG